MGYQYLLERYDPTTWTRTAVESWFDTPEAAIAGTEYPNLYDWQESGSTLILHDRIIQAEGHRYSRYSVGRHWAPDPAPEPAPQSDVDVERGAGRLLLAGAESHIHDALNETGEYSDADFERITGRAAELIADLRAEHNA